MNCERSGTRKCKGPSTKITLAKIEIWNLEVLKSLPLTSEIWDKQEKMYTDASIFAFQNELGEHVLLFKIQIPKLVCSQTWKCRVLKVWSSTEIAVLSFQMCSMTIHCNVMSCLLKGNQRFMFKGIRWKKEATDYCAYFPPKDQCWIF